MQSTDSPLLTAYRQTDYMVQHQQATLKLRVGSRPPAVLQGFRWWLITADNPRSVLISEAINRRRRRQLRSIVFACGWRTWPSCALANPAASWPAEYGWLISECTEKAVFRLAESFEQNALLGYSPQFIDHSQPTVELIPVEYPQ